MATQASLDRVQELYVAYYGRPADQAGQEYWADRLDDEGESAIIDSFGNSAEYDELSEGQGNATLVDNLYQQMFGRPADPEGLTYYTGVLESGEKSLAEIAVTILNAASGVDLNDFNAKVEAAAEYTETYGSAEDYDIVAAKDVVDSAEGGLYTPELTPAIEDYQAAQEAVSDYLQDEVAANETVAAQLETNGADDDDVITDDEIDTALDNALNDDTNGAVAAVEDAGDDIADLSTDASVAAAQIAAQQKAYAEAVDSAEETVSETEGLRAAISSLQSAETRYESALKAEIKTDTALDGEVAKYNALNSGDTIDTTNVEDNGLITDLIVENNGTLEAAEGVDTADLEGFDALLTAAQAQYDATQSVSKSLTAFETALERVQNTEDGTTDADATEGSDGDGDYQIVADEDGDLAEVTLSVGGNAQDLIDAQDTADNFDEAVADYQELTGLQDQVDDLNEAVDDAEDVIEEQDVTLADFTVTGTGDDVEASADPSEDNDLFIFDADAADTQTITAGFGGEDQIYVGDSFTAVQLDSDDTLSSDDLGDVNTLEVFFQQGDKGAVLSFENKAFAGSAENGFDGTEITLTGVNAEDLQLENGYISIA